MNPKDLKRLSKTLSLLLRHQPELYGLTLDRQGWCEVDQLLLAFRQNGQALDRQTLETVVAQNNKQRFSFSPDGMHIRANQGHSIPVELGYQAMQPPEQLYHGTATRFLKSIAQEGLQRQNRHHVHLSADVATATQVGQRHGKPVILLIDSGRMAEEGYVFYRSANGVWLTAEVPVRYFQRLPPQVDN